MKKLLVICITVLTASHAVASERRPLKEVSINAFTKETQVTPPSSGDDHIAIVWWIPNEYWEAVLSRDSSTSEGDKRALLDSMSGISLLAVVQADISRIGAFEFYSKEKVEKEMKVSHIESARKIRTLKPAATIDPDLKLVLAIFKPILGAALGDLGKSMNFYVLDDRTKSSQRLLDPYHAGRIRVQLARDNGDAMIAEIELPLNALFVPRICPNGKEAHVSWNYCPWSGTKLEK